MVLRISVIFLIFANKAVWFTENLKYKLFLAEQKELNNLICNIDKNFIFKYWNEQGHLSLDQAIFMQKLCRLIQPKNALEIGFCTGRSAATVLTAASLNKFISVDLNLDYMANGRKYATILKNTFKNFYVIEDNSAKLLNDKFFNQYFPEGIDWVTIDGDHSYAGCYSDLNAVHSVLNKNGIILVDDYKSGPPNGCFLPSVTKAVDDFIAQHKNIYKLEWNRFGKGFALLTKSSNLHSALLKPSSYQGYNRTEPWLTEEAIEFLKKNFESNAKAKVLEFGCGISTVWLAQRVYHLVSFEHTIEWAKKTKKIVQSLWNTGWVDLCYLPRPYYQAVFQFPDNYFDLVLVDGRDRIECVKTSVRVVRPGGIIMLDNAERDQYKFVYQLLANWKLYKTIQDRPDKFGFFYKNWQTNWWIKPNI